jgi:hypothetical protein
MGGAVSAEAARAAADPLMYLPPGKTCGDCTRFSSCLDFLGLPDLKHYTSCDWAPSRFRQLVPR